MDKLLIVDDERNVHYSFRRVLGEAYELLSAFSGEEALRKVAEESPQLVLLDLRLPGEDGLDTLQALKRLRPELPVIIMTAFATAETAIRATTLNAADYLVKPFDVDALKRLIADTLKRQEPAPLPPPPQPRPSTPAPSRSSVAAAPCRRSTRSWARPRPAT